ERRHPFDLGRIVARNNLAYSFVGILSGDLAQPYDATANGRGVLLVGLHNVNSVGEPVELEWIVPEIRRRMLEFHVSVSVANHCDDPRDLDDDLVARKTGDALVQILQRSVKLFPCYGMEQILVNLRCLFSEVAEVPAPPASFPRSDRGRMTLQRNKDDEANKNRSFRYHAFPRGHVAPCIHLR